MAFGLQIINDIDPTIVKLDENSPQMVLYASGTATTGSTAPPFIVTSLGIISVPHNNTHLIHSRAVIAIRINTPGAYLNIGIPFVNGANYQVQFQGNVSNVNFSWRLYLVATPFTKSTTGYGMEVYDAASNLVYSSNYRPLNLMFCPTVSVVDNGTITHSVVPFGNPWLISPDTWWADYVWNPTYGLYNIYIWGFAMGTNSWTMKRFLLLSANSGITTANGGYARSIIGLNKRVFIGYDL